MSWRGTRIDKILVDEDEFDAEVVAVRELKGRYGLLVCIEFSMGSSDGWEVRVSGLASKKLSASSKLGRWVEAILGRMPNVGEEVPAKDLLNRQCRVVVKHRKSLDGLTTFANVVRVLPATTSSHSDGVPVSE